MYVATVKRVGILFSAKSQCITFGSGRPVTLNILLNGSSIQWVNKSKYLSCYFSADNCAIYVSVGIRKFYDSVSNTFSVTGYNKNEIATIRLVKAYCVPSLLYGCEVCCLNSADYHKVNVIICPIAIA